MSLKKVVFWLAGTFICRRLAIGLSLVAGLAICVPAQAQFLSISFEDPVGDQLGNTDLIGLSFTFNRETGEYEVVLIADGNMGFGDQFVVGVNLFNPDLGTRRRGRSYFHDEADIRNQGCFSTRFILRGFDDRLKEWSEGDRIAPSGPQPLGVPQGVASFTSGVAFANDGDRPEDAIAEGEFGELVEQ